MRHRPVRSENNIPDHPVQPSMRGGWLALVLLAPALTLAAPSLAQDACSDIDRTFTGTVTGAPDESIAGTSFERAEHTLEIGSASCRIVSLSATLRAPGRNETNDAELTAAYEGLPLADSRNPGTDELVVPPTTPAGTWTFGVEPWSALQTPYTLTVEATLTADEDASGPNADDETVVVAIVDTGINPYHDAFSQETYPASLDLTQDPATYIEGFPHDAETLDLSLDDSLTYDQAVAQDGWGNVQEDQLYTIPGTKIVGAYDDGGALDSGHNVLDEDGHGTRSASVAAANTLGSCERCLIVAVEGLGGLDWALAQPWIDVVSNSWGPTANAGVPTAGVNDANVFGLAGSIPELTRPAVERGQTVLFSAGNGLTSRFLTPQSTYTTPTAGPDWVLTVGATWAHDDCRCPDDESTVATSGKPVDVSSYAIGDIPAADHASLSGIAQHSGTSAAAPIVAGVLSDSLLETRKALGDTVGGTQGEVIAAGTPVTGPFQGPVSDGELTRAELESAILHTAEHTGSEFIGLVPPSPPTFFVPEDKRFTQWGAEGWGTVAERTGDDATSVILGEQAMPSRPGDAAFARLDEANRAALWGDPVAPHPDPARELAS